MQVRIALLWCGVTVTAVWLRLGVVSSRFAPGKACPVTCSDHRLIHSDYKIKGANWYIFECPNIILYFPELEHGCHESISTDSSDCPVILQFKKSQRSKCCLKHKTRLILVVESASTRIVKVAKEQRGLF